MKYHSRTLQLLRDRVQRGRPEDLLVAEERLGFRFPEAVREWYSEVDGQLILARFSNQDEALHPLRFKRVEVCGKTLLMLLVENQGVCWWGVELDGSEDPAVYVDFDPPPDKLFQYASSFSEFTYLRLFDFDGWYEDGRFILETRKPLRDETVEWLKKTFREEPTSLGWPGTKTYRYSCPLGRITIWQSEDQADWALTGETPESFQELERQVRTVW